MARNNLARVTAACLAISVFVLTSCQSPPAAAPTSAPAPPATVAPRPAATSAAPTQASAAPTAAAPAQAAAAPAVAAETIKLGLMVSLTGPTARMGIGIDRFVRMAIDDINGKGGVKVGGKSYRFEAVTVDDKSTSEGGREAANRLVLNEKVNFIMGPASTPVAGAQAVTEPAKVDFLAFTAVDKSLGPNFPYTVQFLSHYLMRLYALYDFLVENYPNVKRVAFNYSDDPTGHNIASQAEAYAKKIGLTVVSQDFYPLDIKDFSPLTTRVLRGNPDGIDVGGAGGRGQIFAAQMKALYDQGFRGPTWGVSAEGTVMQANAQFLEDFSTASLTDFHWKGLQPPVQDVINRFISKWNEADLDGNQIPNFNAPFVLAQAMEKAGTVDDTTKIIQTIRQGTFDTIYGPSRFVGEKTFGLNAVIEQPIYMSAVKGGKVVNLSAQKGTLP